MARVERSYAYVGPVDLTKLVSPDSVGQAVESLAEFSAWITDRPAAELDEPFTFVIDLQGRLRLAPRRSEHVVCAGGQRVLGAGEIGFEKSGEGWAVDHVSNQSTGYCPDLESWGAVTSALDRVGLLRPSGFTQPLVFRCCPHCAELNVVKEEFFVCAFCESDLPAEWNIGAIAPHG